MNKKQDFICGPPKEQDNLHLLESSLMIDDPRLSERKIEMLKVFNQTHLLKNFKSLSTLEQNRLLQQIEMIEFDILDMVFVLLI